MYPDFGKPISFIKFYLAEFHKLGLPCNVTETLPYRENTPSRNVRNLILIDQYRTNTQRQLVIRNQDVCIKVKYLRPHEIKYALASKVITIRTFTDRQNVILTI